MTKSLIIAVGILAAALAAPASAQTPEVLAKLYDCKTITDAAARLACYDKNIGMVETAQETGDLIAIDKAGAEEIKRESFGFNIPSIPKLGLFKRDNVKVSKAKKEDFNTATLVIKATRKLASGRTQFTLENGQVWVQAETTRIPLINKKRENTLKIRKASLGSFLGQINGSGRGFRVKRVE